MKIDGRERIDARREMGMKELGRKLCHSFRNEMLSVSGELFSILRKTILHPLQIHPRKIENPLVQEYVDLKIKDSYFVVDLFRCYFGCESMDGKIYAIGGYGLRTSDPHSWDTYNSSTNSWESHSDPNIVLDIEDSMVMDGKIYIRSRTSTIPPHVCMAVYNPLSDKWKQIDADLASGWRGPIVAVDDTLYVLDQSLGTKLMTWNKNSREWGLTCRLSPLLPRPPCQMVAIGRKIFIIGKGLSTVVLDIDNVGNADGMIASTSIPVFSSDDDVISCKCVSI